VIHKDRLFHPVVVLVACIGLGATLIYASWHKVADPPDFAKIIYNYKLFPPGSIHLLAILFPWFELIAGVALLTGVCRRGGAMMGVLFFATFIVALSYNLARDCPTICGCFSTHADGTLLTTEEKFLEMKKEVAVDVGLVLVGIYAYIGSGLREKRKQAAAAGAAEGGAGA